jgi:hypothetical protein
MKYPLWNQRLAECAPDLVIDQGPRCVERLCIVPKRGLFAVQVFRSVIDRGQNGEVRMLTVAEYVQNYPSALCDCTSSDTMLRRAHPTAVRDQTTILSLRLNSICVCLFLKPWPHAERVYADAK